VDSLIKGQGKLMQRFTNALVRFTIGVEDAVDMYSSTEVGKLLHGTIVDETNNGTEETIAPYFPFTGKKVCNNVFVGTDSPAKCSEVI
jgi:hypothetical protein